MGVISSRIRRHRRTRLAAEMACTWNPRRLFPLGQEQGGVYYPDDPNALLRRRNLLTYTTGSYVSPWAVDNSGATNPTVTTNYAEAPDGTMTAARVQLNKTGGVFSRLRWVGAWPVGNPYVVSIYACTTSGLGTANVGLRSADAGGTNMAVTGAWQRFSYSLGTITAPADFQLLLWDSIAGNDETADILIWGAQLERDTTASPYQPVTDWNTEYMAAVGHLVTQFQDSAGTTAVQKVTDPVGLTLDRRFGLARGTTVLSFDGSNTTGWTPTTATVTSASGELVVTSTGAGTFQAIYTLTGLTVGRMYRFDAVMRKGTATNAANIGFNGIGSVAYFGTTSRSCTVHLTATGTSQQVQFYAAGAAGAGETIYLDSLTIVELPGNHRIQATSGSRKTLSARVNLLTKSEQFDDAAWTKGASSFVTANAGTDPLGGSTADRITFDASELSRVQQAITTASASYRLGIWAKSESGSVDIRFGEAGALQNATLTTTWQWLQVTGTYTNPNFTIRNAAAGGVKNILVWGPDLRTADDAAKAIPAYQRVNTASDYDTDGFPFFWLFDGTDDSDATASTVDGSASDKVTVIAGVTKTTEHIGIVAELTASVSLNAASVAQYCTTSPATAWGAFSRGSAAYSTAQAAEASGYLAPMTGVITSVHDIAGDSSVLRVNGVQVAASSVDKGAGNFANSTRYHGRRGGSTLPFNGREYAYIERFDSMSDSERNQAERWVAQRMGVTI